MSYIRFRKHYLHIPYLVLAVLEFAVLLGIFVVLAVAYPFAGGQAAPEDVYSSVLFAGILSLGTLAMGGYTGIVQETVAQLYFRTLVAYCFLGGIGLMLVYAFLPDLDPGSTNLFWAILLCSF
ncbi:MAG TPA: UDP-phosphate galactose phosphotransferase, partial [Marinobacter sp.]|nr:UDP-phosphate galactose phosphotransferase [Marinobacter sp.]